jgi:trk system potassium uptake protein TrkH
LKISRAPVKEEVLAKILAFFVLFIITIFITALCLALTGHNLETSLSAALSCVGNVGPAFAEVGPTDNFAVITDVGKWILVIAMLAGRLELFTILLLFSREYWKHK